MKNAFVIFLVFAVVFLIGLFIGTFIPNEKPDHTQDEIMKSITIEKLFTENQVQEMGGPFSGYAVVSTEGIGYWTGSDAMFLGFEVGKTYCVKVKPNLPQGPIIMQNFGTLHSNETPNTASTGQAASGSQADDNSTAACR